MSEITIPVRRHRGWTPFLFALILGSSLKAEISADPGERTRASATVTVTAEAEPVEVEKTPNPVRIVEGEKLVQNSLRNLADLFAWLLPGQATFQGGYGTVSTPMFNGARPQDLVVLVDGMRIQDHAGLGLNLSEISLVGVDRLELQLGPCSTLHGSEAMGGVLALGSGEAAQKEGYSGQGRASAGDRGYQQLMLSNGWRQASTWVRLDLEAFKSQAPTETKNPYRTASGYFGTGFRLGEGSLRLSYRKTHQGIPLPYVEAGTGVRSYDEVREGALWSEQGTLNLNQAFTDSLMADMSLGQHQQERRQPKYAAPGQDAFTSRSQQFRGGLHFLPTEAFGLSLMAEARQDRAASANWTGGMDTGEARHLSGALEFRTEPWDGFRFTGSFRHQKDRQRSFFPTGQTSGDTHNSSNVWKLGFNAMLGGGLRFYFSSGTGFANPLLYQVIYNTQNHGESLQHEKSRFMQTGFSWSWNGWKARVEASQSRLDTLVYFDESLADWNLGLYGLYRNGSDLKLRSLEGAFGSQRGPWFGEITLRSQETRDMKQAKELQLKSPAFVRRPFFSASLQTGLNLEKWRAALNWNYQGSRYEHFGYDANWMPDIRPSRVHNHNLACWIEWTFHPSMSLSLQGRNLLQPHITKEDWLNHRTDYQNDAYLIFNYPSQPPSLHLSFAWKY